MDRNWILLDSESNSQYGMWSKLPLKWIMLQTNKK